MLYWLGWTRNGYILGGSEAAWFLGKKKAIGQLLYGTDSTSGLRELLLENSSESTSAFLPMTVSYLYSP